MFGVGRESELVGIAPRTEAFAVDLRCRRSVFRIADVEVDIDVAVAFSRVEHHAAHTVVAAGRIILAPYLGNRQETLLDGNFRPDAFDLHGGQRVGFDGDFEFTSVRVFARTFGTQQADFTGCVPVDAQPFGVESDRGDDLAVALVREGEIEGIFAAGGHVIEFDVGTFSQSVRHPQPCLLAVELARTMPVEFALQVGVGFDELVGKPDCAPAAV